MEKNILIISSNYTGHGHKSITDALCEQFAKHPDVNVHVIDGFALRGKMTIRIGKLYGPMTRNAKELWRLVWEISLRNPALLCEVTELTIKESFLKVLDRVKPDLILSVHPNFNGSILNILEESNINIPFVTLIADLVSITPLWADPRADYILCPTVESKYKCLEFGVPESRLKITGFPIRAKFCDFTEDTPDNSYTGERPLECLIMSGGEGSGNMSRIARILLENFNCRVKIVAGRNKVLKRRLENTLPEEYGNRIEIYGFVENIQDLMRSSDIAFTRGSPNTMLEAVCCNVPLVVTGALPGQEEGNPGYLEKYHLGVVCKEVKRLKGLLYDLLADNAEKLNYIKRSQRSFRKPDNAKNIVDFLLSVEKKPDTGLKAAPKKKLLTLKDAKFNEFLPVLKKTKVRNK